ncbi:MAG TPA: hypothetical protein PLJ21_08095 [Pseudobdellovibrionaceae bacterium]|nr:hypothetical protein [Pseudobdellovibrionaceae bacterium]
MKKYFLLLFVSFSLYRLVLAEDTIKVELPNATGDEAGPINDSRAAVNAFSCAEISTDWKDKNTVLKFLKIGHSHGLNFLTWMQKAPQEKRIKIAMNVAGFWNLNWQASLVNSDFYLGRVSANVSSNIYETYLKEKPPEFPPMNTMEYLKNKQASDAELRKKLFSAYECLKLK